MDPTCPVCTLPVTPADSMEDVRKRIWHRACALEVLAGAAVEPKPVVEVVEPAPEPVELKFKCRMCGYQADEEFFVGRCPECRFVCDRIKNKKAHGPTTRHTFLSAANKKSKPWLSTGIAGLDWALGEGLVLGCTLLAGGPPRSGKTTLWVQVSANIATAEHPVVFATREQSASAVAETAERVRAQNAFVEIIDDGNLLHVFDRAKALRARLLVLDSVSKWARASGFNPIEIVEMAIDFAQKNHMAVVLISQVSKDGDFAGAKALEHDVDAVAYMGEPDEAIVTKLRLDEGRRIRGPWKFYRFFVMEKNRNAEERETLFKMSETGLSIVKKRKVKGEEYDGEEEEEDEEEGED